MKNQSKSKGIWGWPTPTATHKTREAAVPQIKPNDDSKGGVKANFWVWASKHESKEAKPKEKPKAKVEGKPASTAQPKSPLPDDELQVNQILLDTPGISGASFLNALKSKGFKIVGQKQTPGNAKADKAATEADSGSSFGAVQRTGSKSDKALQKKKEASKSKAKIEENIEEKILESLIHGRTYGEHDSFLKCRFRESAMSDNGIGPTKFEVVLIEEGLGNLKDRFYYTRQALESAVPLFTGKKFFVDHPDAMEEQTRPERSVRDVAGYFQNLKVVEGDGGQAQLVGELVTFPDEPYRWVRALLREAISFQKSHADKDLIGLSINASGSSQPIKLGEFMNKFQIPAAAIPKLTLAESSGVDEIKLVTAFMDSVSCDIVTEAGAGGKVLSMLESKEKENSMKQHKQSDDEGQDGKHDDQAQDKELIKKMIKKHMGKGDDEDSADESKEAKDKDKDGAASDSMESEMEAYEHFKKEGLKDEEAAKMACAAVRCAKAMQAKKEAGKAPKDADGDADGDAKESKDADSDDASSKKESKEDESKKESALKSRLLKLEGELASFKEAARKTEVTSYLEQKLAQSRLPMSVTKRLKESLGTPKSKKEVDEALATFMEGYTAGRGESTSSISFHTTTEKVGATTQTSTSGFGACVKR